MLRVEFPCYHSGEVKLARVFYKMSYYVYAYIDPRNDTAFYIGAGHGKRDKQHLRRKFRNHIKTCRFFYNKLNKMEREGVQPVVHRLLSGLSRYDAFQVWERFFIMALGRRDLGTGPLCNHTDGGEGCKAPSIETRRRMSESMKANCSLPERKRQMSKIQTLIHNTPEMKQLQSEIAKRTWADPIVRQRRIEAGKSPKAQREKSEASKRVWNNPEARQQLLIKRQYSGPRAGRFKGVGKMGSSWRARLADHHLGTFPTELEAARAYNAAVDLYWDGGGYKNLV